MPKYRVYLHRTDEYTLEVDASDEQAAMEIGLQRLRASKERERHLDCVGAVEVDDAVEIIEDDR